MSAAEHPGVRRLALVVHPARDVSDPVRIVRSWSQRRGVEVVELWPYPTPDPAGERRPGAADGCDAVVSIGGDGTLLASLHAGTGDGVPVLGVSWGSLAALGTVAEHDLETSLDRLAEGRFELRDIVGLEVSGEGEPAPRQAFNDVAISRTAPGQVSLAVSVDGELYARLSGDGVIVSTPLGSTGYAMAAGGPILEPAAEAFLVTPVSSHGGSCPPLVLACRSEVTIEVLHGHDRARVDIDGQPSELRPDGLRIVARPGGGRLVVLDRHPFLRALRARRLVLDSPRVDDGRRR